MKNKYFSFLGISLLTSFSLIGMDADTFLHLIGRYNAKEITHQELIHAYYQIEATDVQTTANAFLEAQGTPIATIESRAQEEAEQYTYTFDTLIALYKSEEITKDQLIQAYDLFQTDDDRHLGDQVLATLLNTTIDQLKAEGVVQNVPQVSHHEASYAEQSIYRRDSQRRKPTAFKRIPGATEQHLNMVREQNKRRAQYLLARAYMNQVRNNKENKDLEKALAASLTATTSTKEPIKNSPTPQARLRNPITNSQEYLKRQERLRQDLVSAPQATRQVRNADQEDSSLVHSHESIQAQDISPAQSQDVPPIHMLLNDAQEELNAEQAHIQRELRGDGSSSQQNHRTNVINQASKEELRPLQRANERQERHVRFNIPEEQNAQARLDRPAPGREHLAPQQEACSVNLSITGTPVFTKGKQIFNPVLTEIFNKGLASMDRATITSWGQQLAQLAQTDAQRQKAIKPLIKALNKPNAPRENINVLMQRIISEFRDPRQYQELLA